MHQMRISTTRFFSDAQVEKVGNPKKVNTVKQLSDENQTTMKLSQIRRRIELCLEEIILRFEMNF
jgi:hypothetical protein